MQDKPPLNIAHAHRHFAADCFNRAWELIDRPTRTTDEDDQMLGLAHASLWHWTQRPDCTDTHRSIGYWQLSRVYALVGDASNARRYGQRCLETSPQDDPFSVGYAYEALSRAAVVAGDDAGAGEYLAEGWRRAEQVAVAEQRQLLAHDLQGLEAAIRSRRPA